MQVRDDAKRNQILAAAAEHFAAHRYHDVRLEDVARRAHVGKGTLYVYFKSKEQLYASVVVRGLTDLIARLDAKVQSSTCDSWTLLTLIIREFVAWAHRFPNMFQLMRQAEFSGAEPGMREKRRELGRLIGAVIRQGVAAGQLRDLRPELTGQMVPSLVRGAMRFGPANLGQKAIVNHVLRVLGSGIRGDG